MANKDPNAILWDPIMVSNARRLKRQVFNTIFQNGYLMHRWLIQQNNQLILVSGLQITRGMIGLPIRHLPASSPTSCGLGQGWSWVSAHGKRYPGNCNDFAETKKTTNKKGLSDLWSLYAKQSQRNRKQNAREAAGSGLLCPGRTSY